MQSLMDRYSLDGRDPNSYTGYAWVLGRYDRPWPRRPIFGTIRYMSSESARRKLKMSSFLKRYRRRTETDAEVSDPHCESFTSACMSAPTSSTALDEVQPRKTPILNRHALC